MAKKKKLPAWATTVTPLSKTIALGLFILLPILAFYFGRMYQKAYDDANHSPVLIMREANPMPSVVPHQMYLKQ